MIKQRKLEEFLRRNRIADSEWEEAQLAWGDLIKIGVDHEEHLAHLEASAALLANVIQRFGLVHSVRWRVKDVEHLLAKIVRKRAEGNEKYADISVDTYTHVVTDLIGIRALHLFKTDCFEIDKSIRSSFNLTEKPVAYVREGDDLDLRDQYQAADLEVKDHPKGYRSIHYVLTTQPLKRSINVEIQVRTVFEEGWSEIDHTVRYPNFANNVQLEYVLAIFNRMAGSADEMGGFVRTLAKVLTDANLEIAEAVRARDESVAKMEAALQQLAKKNNSELDSEQITTVQTELSKLKADSGTNSAVGVRVDLLKWIGEVGIGAHDPKLFSQIQELSAVNTLSKQLRQMQDLDRGNALSKKIKQLQDPGGLSALAKHVKQVQDQDRGNALSKKIKQLQDPDGINAILKKSRLPPAE